MKSINEKQTLKEDIQAHHNAKAKEVEALLRDFNQVFGSKTGKRVLKHIMQLADWGKSPVKAVRADGGKIDDGLSTYAAARLTMYIDIRNLVSSTILKEVEFD